jgi:aspartyl-tRNA(Asn)/glutamyl-tRNA(Gln) amidotransferase subunit C
MSIDLAQVHKVAHLARLALTPQEEEQFTQQLNDILGYVEQISELDLLDVPPTTRAIDVANVTRPDQHQLAENRAELLAGAPAQDGDFFRVPKILADAE